MSMSVEVFCREVPIGNLMQAVRNAAAVMSQVNEDELERELSTVVDQIRTMFVAGQRTRYEVLNYAFEEELFGYSVEAADFLILELPTHFRQYDIGGFPESVGATYVSMVRDVGVVRKRASGHVTASFAEAMCPWVLERLGISDGTFCRFSSLAPSVWGDRTPDFLVSTGGQEVPCEVKHYADESRIRWDGIKTAITQVVTALLEMPADEAYVFAAIAHPSSGHRYKIELIRLVS
jgi:hypothetical protein